MGNRALGDHVRYMGSCLMMSYLDKTFCSSPHCNNACGRRMTTEEARNLYSIPAEQRMFVSTAYFCGEPITLDLSQDESI